MDGEWGTSMIQSSTDTRIEANSMVEKLVRNRSGNIRRVKLLVIVRKVEYRTLNRTYLCVCLSVKNAARCTLRTNHCLATPLWRTLVIGLKSIEGKYDHISKCWLLISKGKLDAESALGPQVENTARIALRKSPPVSRRTNFNVNFQQIQTLTASYSFLSECCCILFCNLIQFYELNYLYQRASSRSCSPILSKGELRSLPPYLNTCKTGKADETTAILSSVDSSSDSKEKTSSSSPEVGQVTEDEGSGLAARRSRVVEAADGRDERTISEWVNFLKDSEEEFIELAKHHLWLEPDEMVMTLDKSQVRLSLGKSEKPVSADVVLGEAKNSDDLAIKEIAMTLAEQQVQGWLTGRKSPGEVLTLLKLQEGYVSAKLEALIRFVMVYDTKNSSDVVLLDLLTSKFGKRELTSILAKAVTSDAPANAPALKLETQLFATWKMRPVNPEDVLHWLGINVYTVKNLTDPRLRQFFRYIDLLERTDSQLALEFVKTFVQRVENDFVARALVEARVTAKETGSTNKNVGKLEAYVFEWWIRDGESAYDVVKLLKLDNYNIEKTFTARVEVLEDFIKALEEKKSTVVDLLSILSRAFNGQDKFIDFLGKNGLRSNTKALDFKAMLLKKWGDHQFSPKQVLEELKMTESVENLTGSRVAISMEYIETYPESGLSLGDMLRDNYKIEDLAKALVSIKKNGSLNKGVSELTTQLLTGWVNDAKNPKTS
uniref:RxLR effector candidate protein n=1 Tax=Hyaloperonospora arabidopsidis (strain Emoy2) TaxID=559515 RepID=M4C0E5_HYAAE